MTEPRTAARLVEVSSHRPLNEPHTPSCVSVPRLVSHTQLEKSRKVLVDRAKPTSSQKE